MNSGEITESIEIHLQGGQEQRQPAPQRLVSTCLEQIRWQFRDLSQLQGYLQSLSLDHRIPEELCNMI